MSNNGALRQPEPDELELWDVPSAPVPGLGSLAAGLDPKPYPINIYNIDGDSTSGIAGTLHPDGWFAPLPNVQAPQTCFYWDEVLAKKVPGTVVWNGCVAGGLELGLDGPHRRRVDGSLQGDWPLNPPRPEKLRNPEKARLVAEEENGQV